MGTRNWKNAPLKAHWEPSLANLGFGHPASRTMNEYISLVPWQPVGFWHCSPRE